MSHIQHLPPDIENLIWSLAETNDPQAIEDFGRRYPQYRAAMGRRLHMVRQLKISRPAERTSSAPLFRRPEVARTQKSFRLSFAIGSLAFAAFGLAVYTVATLTNAPTTTPTAEPSVVVKGSAPMPAPTPQWNTTAPVVHEPEPVHEPQPEPDHNASAVLPEEEPQTFKLRSVPLLTALEAIGEAGKFQLEIAPGMPNPVVSVDYAGLTSVEILNELGRQFSFTAFDQGNRTVLIIPAVDRHSGQPSFSLAPAEQQDRQGLD